MIAATHGFLAPAAYEAVRPHLAALAGLVEVPVPEPCVAARVIDPQDAEEAR